MERRRNYAIPDAFTTQDKLVEKELQKSMMSKASKQLAIGQNTTLSFR